MNAHAVAIVRSTLGDAAEILALQKSAFASEGERYDDFSLPPLIQTIEQTRERYKDNLVLKATGPEGLIDSVQGRIESGVCFVSRLFVHPAARGRGVGLKLMLALEARFPGAERFELFTGSKSLECLELYAKLGYREFRRAWESEKVELVYLEKFTEPEALRESLATNLNGAL